MRLLGRALVLRVLAGVLIHPGVQPQPRASMGVGLVIQDRCEVMSSSVSRDDLLLQPRVACALRHPFRLERQIAQQTPGFDSRMAAALRGDPAKGVWLVEF
jgi:hypothetical protein